VLQNVEQHRKFLSEQYDAYKSYLDDVRGKCAVNNQAPDKKKKQKKDKVGKVAGPYKYSYLELEKAGIIKTSQVPKERYTLAHNTHSSLSLSLSTHHLIYYFV